MEEMTRSTKVLFDMTAESCTWEIQVIVTESEWDYWYWPVLQTLKVVHRTDAFECVVHTEQNVDWEWPEFTEEYVAHTLEKYADTFLID